jgi:ABC-type nitrate/sulfonate/bicarbonate transport system permease component
MQRNKRICRKLETVVARAWQTFAIEQLYVAVIVSGLLGACLHSSLKLIEARVLPWRSS